MRDANRPEPTAEEIRTIVRQVVDAMLPPDRPAAAPEPAAAAAPGASGAAPASSGAKVTVAIGGDHGGYVLKDKIGAWLRQHDFDVRDCGTNSPEAVDYPDIAHAVAKLVSDGTCRWGIIVDGAGIGSCMVANKLPGVRAGLCYDLSTARNAREHNHANVLTLGAGLVGERLALDIVQTWLATVSGLGRHAARVDKITAIERQYLARPREERA
jgi:ribose 5-phosphate isomerase B